jgi:hypothetical protein
MYFTEELKNALNFGYKIDILWGYIFEKGNILSDYVNDLYNLRLEYPKTDPMNYTAKILLNSLYGRFGMNDDFNLLDIVNQKELMEMEKSHLNISDIITFNPDKFLITFTNPSNKMVTIMDGNKETHNVNIAIASAVTAYARIHMSQFKNNPSFPARGEVTSNLTYTIQIRILLISMGRYLPLLLVLQF